MNDINWTDHGQWEFQEMMKKAGKKLGLIKEVKEDGTIVFDGERLLAFGAHYDNLQKYTGMIVPPKAIVESTFKKKKEETKNEF